MTNSDINSLIDDILILIFEAISVDQEGPASTITSVSSAPILLTHVCRRWRATTLSLPSLWSTIRVPICLKKPIPTNESGRPLHDKITLNFPVDDALPTWLSRSGTAQLHISIILHDVPWFTKFWHPGLLPTAMPLTWKHIPVAEGRVRALEMHGFDFSPSFIDILTVCAPHLETLVLAGRTHCDYVPAAPVTFPVLETLTLSLSLKAREGMSRYIHAPNLVRVSLRDEGGTPCICHKLFVEPQLRLESLHVAYSSSLNTEAVHSMLENLPGLKSLCFVNTAIRLEPGDAYDDDFPRIDLDFFVPFMDKGLFHHLASDKDRLCSKLERLVVPRDGTMSKTRGGQLAVLEFLGSRVRQGVLKHIELVIEADPDNMANIKKEVQDMIPHLTSHRLEVVLGLIE